METIRNEMTGKITARVPEKPWDDFHCDRAEMRYIPPLTMAPNSGMSGIIHMSVETETCCKSDSIILALQFLPCRDAHT
jgi:hypothetical protein